MTELTLKVNHAAKSVQTTGRVAVGEDVALNLVMDEEVADLAQLRVRLRFMGRDVAVFPFPGSADEWQTGEAGENEYTYTGVINLNTVQLNALFAELGDGAVLTCAVVVDQVSNDDGTDDYNVLYGKGAIRVWNWNGDLHITPDVDEAPAPVSLRECLDGKIDKVVTATSGNIAVFVNNESVHGGITDANVSIDNGGAPITSGASLPTVSKVGSIVSGSLGPINTAIVELRAAVQQKADATALSEKVDVEDGKELSSNDFTDALKAKLDEIESGAQKNVGVEFTQAEKDKLADIEDKATKVVVDEEFDNQSGNAISNARVAAFHDGYHTFKTLVEETYLPAKADLENGKVPVSQLPAFVSDVKEYPSASDFPEEGEAEKIYVAKDTNLTYRWSGTGYVEISQSLALGETASTAYAGNKGKANADAIAAIKDGTSIDSFGDVEGALKGKYAKPATGIPATDLAAAVQASLGKADTALQSAPVSSVNGQTGAVVLTASDVGAAPAADLRYALGEVLAPDASGAVALADRAVNVVLLVNTIATLTLNFPASVSGHMRDFLVVIAAKADVTAPEIALPDGVVAANADGAIPAIATTTESGGTAVTLLCFSEILADYFFVKGEGMKAVANE